MKKITNKLDGFFENGEDSQSNACVNFMLDHSNGYAWGYKEAADCLAENAVGMNKQDIFIYPIAFLYRHYLELRLKIIIKKGSQLLDRDNSVRTHHRIMDLWREAKAIIQKIWKGSAKDPQLKLTNSVIERLWEIDPDSQAFRYPADKANQKHLSTIKYINISELAKTMGEISSFLEAVSLDIVNRFETKLEWMVAMESIHGTEDEWEELISGHDGSEQYVL